MSERTLMMGQLAQAEKKQAELRLKAEGLCATIRQDISPVLSDIEEMDIPRAAQMMDDLVMIHGELLVLQSRIARLNKELGNGQ